jgi:prepilin-type N-terminal cleavage/methylation domain-containing protein
MNRRSSRDRGFTLVELLISLTLMGTIAAVATAVISTTIRTSPVAADATDEARTVQGIVTWLPQDVDSTPPTGFDTNPATSSGCTQSSGVNLLHMAWTEDIGGGLVRYFANYRHVVVDGRPEVHRVTCSGVGSGPFGTTADLRVSAELPPLPVGWTAGSMPFAVTVAYNAMDETTVVSVAVLTLKGDVVRIDAAPKNPANTLPTTTTVAVSATTSTSTTSTAPPTTTTVPSSTTTVAGSTTTSTTTTTTTTTTLPPACVVTSASISPASIKNTDPNGNGNSATNVGVLSTPATITVITTGYCTGLEARASTGAPNGELFRNFSSSGATYTVVFPGYPQGSSELWADGSRVISFYSPTGGPYGSVTLEVK